MAGENGHWSAPIRLGDLVQITHGWPFKSHFFSEELTGKPIVVNIGNFEYTGGFRFHSTTVKEYRADYPSEYKLKPNDILLVMTCQTAGGEILGIPGRIPDDGNTYLHNQRMGKVVVKEPTLVEPGFLYWLFLWSEFNRELYVSASGTKILHTAPKRIEAFKFRLPPLPEQRAIANILGSLDDKIELNRRMNETLEGIARALFKSWFVDFDPVRAKMDGRQPAGMSPEIANLFPSEFEHVNGELVPKGWKQSQLANEIGFQGGFAFKSRDWQDEGVPVVKIGSVKPGIIDLEQVSFVSTEIAEQASRYRLGVGDLLIGMTGYVGEVGIVPPAQVLPLLNQRVGKFVLPTAGTPTLGFWYCTTRRREFRSFVEGRSHGTAQANVSASAIMDYPLIAPSPSVMQCFNSTSEPMFDRILENHGQMRLLANLRDTLLPKLLSGELRVPEADNMLEEVL